MNPAPVPSTPESESAPELANGVKRWRVGTLTYGTAGLIVLFCWLLWGDFAWNMKERAVQPMSQLLFKQFKASDLVLGLMVTSLPAALGMLIGPIVSVRSDNHRGRWGRRIPYLLIPTPIAAVAMIGMGYTVEIADLLRGVLGADAPDPIACRLIVFAGLWTFFEIFTVIANSVFVGLINDVVPQAVIGRFFALFRIVGLGAGIVDRLKEQRYKIKGVNFGNKSKNPMMWGNKRAEMWGTMKDWLRSASIPEDRQLKADLVGPTKKPNSSGTIFLEGKKEMRSRGLASPDAADALAVTFAFPVAHREYTDKTPRRTYAPQGVLTSWMGS
jgi:hypothetical protein